ncbi:MAG: type II toxin-antitoxin system RelE/ParE family toxin [Prolixibacteraceae bacterium]|nr:type II toxin-antitoxin system RelE/ParE family toxin [Prolixibacteraceae bacterium]
MKATYSVVFSKSAAKEIRNFPKSVIIRIIIAAEKLAIEPRPAGCKKLKGNKEQVWRLRIGDYHIIYVIEDSIRIVEIRKVRHRKDVSHL